jgi:hypothetical protein
LIEWPTAALFNRLKQRPTTTTTAIMRAAHKAPRPLAQIEFQPAHSCDRSSLTQASGGAAADEDATRWPQLMRAVYMGRPAPDMGHRRRAGRRRSRSAGLLPLQSVNIQAAAAAATQARKQSQPGRISRRQAINQRRRQR